MDVLLQQLPEGRKPTYVLLGRVRWRIKPPEVTTQCLHLNPLRSATGRVDSRLEGTGWCELHHGGFPSWGKSISQLHQNFWGNCIRIADLSHPGRFWEFSKPSVGCHSIWRRAESRWVASWTARHSWERWIHCRWTVLSKFISQALESQQESVIQETS